MEDPPPGESIRLYRSSLTIAQKAALEHSRSTAEKLKHQSLARIKAVLERSKLPCDDLSVSSLIARLCSIGRIAVHFHPDRLCGDGRSVVAALHEDGIYRSQFETRISNGGLTAFPGGDRFNWEDRLFGEAYSSASAAERPKYGALDLLRHSDGAAPRFGSCYLRLKPQAMLRATFSMGDSFLHPTDNGPMDSFAGVLAGLLESIEAKKITLGITDLTVASFVASITDIPPHPFHHRHGRTLDEYIETQIHGSLNLATDVEMLVCDPSFRGTSIGDALDALAKQCSFPLFWHKGFRLSFDLIPSDFRGPAMPLLAARLKMHYADERERETGEFSVDLVGRAAVAVAREPHRWSDWGTSTESLQHLKQMWHVLVHCGNIVDEIKR